MSSGAIIALSPAFEQWSAVMASAIVLLLAIAAVVRRGQERPPDLDAPIPVRTERALIGVVIIVALTLRTAGWDRDVTPVFFPSERSMLFVARMLEQGIFWPTWAAALWNTQVSWSHDSAVVLLVMTGLQSLVGPRFGLPALEGALMGGMSVVLAWMLGRRVRSQAFGLIFAALIAVSPLQLTWSRLGPFYVGAVPHVLLAMLVGWLAGRRGSIALAVLTGLLAWMSMYHYYAARVAIPLAFVAMVAGAQRSRRPSRVFLTLVVAGVAFAGVAWALHREADVGTIWPSYRGYAGNKGEGSVTEFVARNVPTAGRELRKTVERYFTRRRTGWVDDPWTWGMAHGGLCLAPVAIVGLIGLLATVRRVARQWLWLVLAAWGLALPVLSLMTARRVLIFDVAWCAFAAHGLLALVDGLGRRVSHAARAVAAASSVALLALTSAATVYCLNATLAPYAKQPIPFGEAGFGDGLACKRCLAAAKGWVDDIADGAFVVLFDNDLRLENPTSPGGLATYGKIASRLAGRPERFVEAYALMADRDWDAEPPTIFDETTTNFGAYLSDQIDRAAPRRIVWHFERPSTWERWLAGQLVAAGGVASEFPTPLAQGIARPVGLRVTTPWDRRDQALARVRDLAKGTRPGTESTCVTLVGHPPVRSDAPVFQLVTNEEGLARPPDWLLTSWRDHRFASFRLTTATPPAGGRMTSGAGGVVQIELMGERGERTLYELPSLRRRQLPAMTNERYGLNCAAYVDGYWWVVRPADGRLVAAHPAAAAVPKAPWLGITVSSRGEVVLVSADQRLIVFDPGRRSVVASFPARVVPSLRETTDECTPIAAGAEWFATANLRSGVLSVYDRTGVDLGTRRLDDAMHAEASPSAIAGAGRFLGAAAGPLVQTFEVRLDPSCTGREDAMREVR